MISLFLDTSSKKLVAGLVKNEEIISYVEKETLNDHSKYLVPIIDEELSKNNIDIKDVGKIIVVRGPGSFTGTRIAVTVAKTISYALNIPVVSVSSLKQYVFEYENNDYYAVILSDKGDKAYFGIYDKDYNEVLEEYTSLDVIKEKVINLQGKVLVITNLDIDFTYRTTEMKLNLLKLVDYYKDKEDNSFNIKPSYIKKIEVEEKL
ncbi:MAG: tRNA (adenosine(37)-N6)-threonylcarbamoyltransferase complex dimerization subunit type 1 TsaB [Bacilli bacterium]|nr:tRNA (adenosine(37)-N6)-threonylcarbamoyltransferase complex dimerization subunit type 1 TsaB [Bacilli bacterium]